MLRGAMAQEAQDARRAQEAEDARHAQEVRRALKARHTQFAPDVAPPRPAQDVPPQPKPDPVYKDVWFEWIYMDCPRNEVGPNRAHPLLWLADAAAVDCTDGFRIFRNY